MPKQTRWTIKRELEYAIGNVDAANEKVVRVGSRFKGVHDDYYQALESIFVSLSCCIEAIKKVKDMI